MPQTVKKKSNRKKDGAEPGYYFARPTGNKPGLAMGNWACSSYKKEKAENQGAGQKLKIVRKEEKVFLQKTITLIKIVSLNN